MDIEPGFEDHSGRSSPPAVQAYAASANINHFAGWWKIAIGMTPADLLECEPKADT